MSETKFTPGRWQWVGIGDEIYVETEHTKYIASLKQYGYSSEETQEANAHLIAAAPELYEALEKCAEVLQNFVGFSHPYIKEANAALAKARGEL